MFSPPKAAECHYRVYVGRDCMLVVVVWIFVRGVFHLLWIATGRLCASGLLADLRPFLAQLTPHSSYNHDTADCSGVPATSRFGANLGWKEEQKKRVVDLGCSLLVGSTSNSYGDKRRVLAWPRVHYPCLVKLRRTKDGTLNERRR